jgi:hypothetical protein
MTNLKGKNILIVSNEPWGDVWYSKQNYAYELSKNNRVFFINPTDKWSFKNLFTFNVNEGFYSDSLSYVNYTNFLPAKGKLLDIINNYITSKRLKNWLQNSKKIENYIFWSFDPIRLYNHKLIGAKIGIFHCVDLYNMNFFGEKIILRNSNILLSSSSMFNDLYSKFPVPKYVIKHCISMDQFTIDEKEKEKVEIELKSLDVDLYNFGLFVGNIDQRTNLYLINLLAETFPHKKFVLIGNFNKNRELDLNKNILLMGPRNYKKLKYYVHFSEFCFSFLIQQENNTINSHKILLYLAQGKPVFSSFYKDYENTSGLLYMGKSDSEIKNLLLSFFDKGEEQSNREKRIQYAKNYTFEKTLLKIEEILKNFTQK